MLGYTRDALAEMHVSDLLSEKDAPYVVPALREVKETSDYRHEWYLQRKNGSLFPAEVIATMTPDGNLLAVIRDSTERKRSEARFRWLVDSNAQGVMFWNMKGEVTGANDAFLRIVGYDRADLEAGRIRWMDMTPPEYAEQDRKAMEELASKGICAPMEKEYIRKDGSRISGDARRRAVRG